MKIIETEVWKDVPDKPGYVTFDRTKTIEEWWLELEKEFKACGPDRFEWFGLAGSIEHPGAPEDWRKETPFPQGIRFACFCEQGMSEGYLVKLLVLLKTQPPVLLLMGKCFELEYAWLATVQLSQLLGIMPTPGAPLVYARHIQFNPMTDALWAVAQAAKEIVGPDHKQLLEALSKLETFRENT